MSPIQDVRYALRGMQQNPGFAAAVIMVLALGIGANAAVFGLVNGIVLKDLPVEKPEELVRFARPSFSYPIFQEVQARGQDVFQGLFAWSIEDIVVAWNEEPETAQVLVATDDFYSTLGVSAVRGRKLNGDDEGAVISFAAWTRRFNRSPSAVGSVIRIGRQPMTIIGITPEGFFGVAPGMAPDITIPVRALPKVWPDDAGILQASGRAWLHLMGRLKPGITIEQGNAALQIFWPLVMDAVTNPNMPAARRAIFLARATALEPANTGFSRVRNSVEQPLKILSVLVGLLLLVACVTVANLLLARAGARRQEIAVRVAIGASRRRIMAQLFTEGLVLAVVSGVLGLLIAIWGSAGLMALLSTPEDPVWLESVLDIRVLAFTMSLSILTASIFAMAPAFRAARLDVAPALKADARVLSGAKHWLGGSLVVVQVGVSMVLLVGAALFVRSLSIILSQDTGFDREGLLVVSPNPLAAGYEGSRLAAFYEELTERLRTQPGVRSVSLSQNPPISGEEGTWTNNIGIDGGPMQQGRETTHFNAVSPGFFRTLGMQFVQGRDFGTEEPQGGKTVIINQLLARAFFPGQDPIGHRISVGLDPLRQNLEIVGVVEDAKYQTLQEEPRRIAYLPVQMNRIQDLFLVVRSETSLSALAGTVRREVQSLDRSVPVTIQTVEDRIRETLMPERVIAILSAVLGSLAVLLAAAGLYGLMAYQVTRRTNEMGLRIALGASGRHILILVLRKSLVVAGIGVLFGLGASLALGRFIRASLYGITSSDPLAFVVSIAIMAAVAFLAGYLPARRASRVDPAVALRQT